MGDCVVRDISTSSGQRCKKLIHLFYSNPCRRPTGGTFASGLDSIRWSDCSTESCSLTWRKNRLEGKDSADDEYITYTALIDVHTAYQAHSLAAIKCRFPFLDSGRVGKTIVALKTPQTGGI